MKEHQADIAKALEAFGAGTLPLSFTEKPAADTPLKAHLQSQINMPIQFE